MSPLALILVLGAALAHAAWNVIAHGASGRGLPFLWCGSVISTVLWLPVVFVVGLPASGALEGFLWGVGVSAILHVAYMLVLQRGYAAGNLSTVYATARGSGPLLTVVVAIVALGERPAPLALVGVAAIISGVVAIGFIDRKGSLTPRHGWRLDPGIAYGLLTGVAIAAYTLWDAQAIRVWDISPVAFMVGCTALEIPLFTLLMGRRMRTVIPVARREWRRLLAFGVLSPLSYILVLTALSFAPVALVAPTREVSVVMVSLFGAFVLHESRPGARLAASAVVVGGIALLAI